MTPPLPDRIPTREECDALMARYAMLPNIVAHSRQVMRVSLAIADHLQSGVSVNRDLVVAAALLHDITKTRSLETHERHDASGGALLREMGFARTAEIVEQHVLLRDVDLDGGLEEREIVCYADKRVRHDAVVTLEERIQDLIARYGDSEEIRRLIHVNSSQIFALERKIAGFMTVGIEEAIRSQEDAG